MLPELRFERDLTTADRQWLQAIDNAMQPIPMVSMEQYIAAIDSNDYITRQNQRLHRKIRRLKELIRALQKSRRSWKYGGLVACAAAGMAFGFAVGVMR